MPEAPNAVRELAEDPTSRKRFLRQAGGTGVAASLAAFIAACGGNDSSSSMSSWTVPLWKWRMPPTVLVTAA